VAQDFTTLGGGATALTAGDGDDFVFFGQQVLVSGDVDLGDASAGSDVLTSNALIDGAILLQSEGEEEGDKEVYILECGSGNL